MEGKSGAPSFTSIIVTHHTMHHLQQQKRGKGDDARLRPFRIVGLCGRKGSGKDAVASVLVQRHGFVRVAFADALKDAARAIYGLRPGQVDDPHLKEIVDPFWGVTPRAMMQGLGMLLREHGGQVVPDGTVPPGTGVPLRAENVWIDAAFREIDRVRLSRGELGPVGVVVTDVRFPNEAERIVAHEGGTVFRVRRARAEAVPDAHVSEHALDHLFGEFPELDNNVEGDLRSVEALADRVVALLDERDDGGGGNPSERDAEPLVKAACRTTTTTTTAPTTTDPVG